jgi:hypothetical protein
VTHSPSAANQRQIIRAEALSWLAAHPAPPAASVITSLPDLSEFPVRELATWRAWFLEAAQRVLAWLPEAGVAIFFQSDIQREGVWIDKGYLVMRAAEELGAQLLFHKIVCRQAPGALSHGRASYSHLLGFSRTVRAENRQLLPDVLAQAGFMPWSKAMGVHACRLACEFLRSETATELVVDPFCGHGTVLAVANAFGFAALGIDRSSRQCRAARKLVLAPELLGTAAASAPAE